MALSRNVNPNRSNYDSSTTSQHIDRDLFIDTESAAEFACEICKRIVVNPYEHIPSNEINCDSIFCLPCAKAWIGVKKVSCPAEGCLTSGFTLDSLRPLGTREKSRLSKLKVKCEFNCGEIVSYGDYFSHRRDCPENPFNVCRICETAIKADHDCKTIFNLLRDCNKTLEQENDQLRNENVKLKEELEDVRGAVIERMMKKDEDDGLEGGTSLSENKKNRKSKKSNNEYSSDEYDIKDSVIETKIRKPPPPPSSDRGGEVRDWLRGPVPQYKFLCNCVEPMPGIDRICLYFHCAEKTYTIDKVDPRIQFKTLRSLLTDMMGHDPGQILFMQHRLLKDEYTIEQTSIPPGISEITFLPWNTPDYGEPGFQLFMYRLKNSYIMSSDSKSKSDRFSSPMDELASGLLASQVYIKFFSNNVEPQPGETQIKLMLRVNGKSYSVTDVKPKMTFGEIRKLLLRLSGKDPGKMIYITHRVIKDEMTVTEAGISFGLTDLTLLSPSFPEKFEPGRSLHLIRF